jgi:hypothetical protein
MLIPGRDHLRRSLIIFAGACSRSRHQPPPRRARASCCQLRSAPGKTGLAPSQRASWRDLRGLGPAGRSFIALWCAVSRRQAFERRVPSPVPGAGGRAPARLVRGLSVPGWQVESRSTPIAASEASRRCRSGGAIHRGGDGELTPLVMATPKDGLSADRRRLRPPYARLKLTNDAQRWHQHRPGRRIWRLQRPAARKRLRPPYVENNAEKETSRSEGNRAGAEADASIDDQSPYIGSLAIYGGQQRPGTPRPPSGCAFAERSLACSGESGRAWEGADRRAGRPWAGDGRPGCGMPERPGFGHLWSGDPARANRALPAQAPRPES